MAMEANFTRNNLSVLIDDEGIVTMKCDSKRTIETVGSVNATGKQRKADLISSTRGTVVVGTCRLMFNASRA